MSDHSTQAMHAWHTAKMRFVTLLSTEINSLEKIVILTEKSLSWSSNYQLMEPFVLPVRSYSDYDTQAKSEHSQACIVLT